LAVLAWDHWKAEKDMVNVGVWSRYLLKLNTVLSLSYTEKKYKEEEANRRVAAQKEAAQKKKGSSDPLELCIVIDNDNNEERAMKTAVTRYHLRA